jgi:DNA-binding beta-propeller fold protein YncE
MSLRSLLAAVVLLVHPLAALGQATDLGALSIAAGADIHLGKGVDVVSGDVACNGTLSFQKQAATEASVAVLADTIQGAPGAVVHGVSFYNHVFPHFAVFVGQQISPVPLPILTLPQPPAVTPPPAVDVTVPTNGSVTLTPGGYRSIQVAGPLILLDGAYDVDDFRMRGTLASVRCNPGSANTGACTVRVQRSLILAGQTIGLAGSLPLVFSYVESRNVIVGRRAAQIAQLTVTAPFARLTLKSTGSEPSQFTGHFVAQTVTVQRGAIVTLEVAPPTCGDGILQPGEQCDPPADAACPGACLSSCTCATPGVPVLYSIGPSVLNNATSFGVQVFGLNFQPGAQLELRDKTTSALIETLPTTFVSSGELTARVPAGMPVPSGIQRELTPRVVNPGGASSGPPLQGHCQTDIPGSPIACTSNADCPPGAGTCVTGDQRLTMFNDAVFLNPNSAAVVPGRGLCEDDTQCLDSTDCTGIGSGACAPKLYVTPQQRDELWVYNTGTRTFVDEDPGQPGIQGIPVGDNPFHVEILDLGGGLSRAWVVNRFEDSFSIVDTATDAELARVTGAALGIPGGLRMETEIEFNRAHARAYLSNENLDEVQVLDISGANRDAPVVVGTIDVGVNPRGMATNAADTRLYVANIQSADVSVVDIAPGSPTENQVIATVAPRATDDIVGGRADGWEAFVIGGRAPRGVAYSDSRNLLFVTSIGPQTGPRTGVSQTGGAIINPTVTVIDAATNSTVAHVALNGLDPNRFSCSDPELMALDDARDRLYVTCQGSGVVDVLDTSALGAGAPAELAEVPLPLPSDATVPTLTLNTAVTGDFGAKVCAGFTASRGTPCTTDADCSGCPTTVDGLPARCCALNNQVGLHNGPRGIAISEDRNTLWVVNQFTTSVATLDVSPPAASAIAVTATTSFPGAFGADNEQRDRRLGQIEFFTDLKKTNVSCATCHIDDHQDGVFFEADVAGPRLRRVLSVRGTRDTPPLLQDQLLPDLVAFTDIVVHVERGGPVCQPCTELGGSFFCFPAPEATCTMTSNTENQDNTLYAKAITFFPNPNLNPDGSFSTSVALPGGGTGDAVRGEAVFQGLACARCHPEPLFTLDQFRVFNPSGFSSIQSVRMRDTGTPVLIPLRTRCQDGNRPTGADGSSGFGVPTLRGIWDTFPLLLSGSAGLQSVGSQPTFSPGCTSGASGCCTELRSPLNPGGTPVPEQHLAVGTKDAMRAVLTAPLAVPGTGHGAALGLPASDLDALIAYLRSL